MKLRIKFILKPFLNYLAVILFTALGITSVLIALPLTEKFSERTPFDLSTKDNLYWSKEYTLKLNSQDKKDIEESKNILYKRLKAFNVEKLSVRTFGQNQEGETVLKVIVTSTQDEELVKELLTNQFDIQIVTRKDDVDFFDEENQYAYLFVDNYNATNWSRDDFRNVYITELKTSDNTYSNFAIFKPWLTKNGDFTRFLEQHKGEYIGVSIDGFVTPYLIPLEDQSIFALPITIEDPIQIKAVNILYNSGVIPVALSLDSEMNLTPQILRVDHIKITLGLVISFLLTYIYLLLIKQETFTQLRRPLLATILTISIYLTILKFFQIPIDTFLLPIQAILIFVLIKVLSENEDSIIHIETTLIMLLLLIKFLGIGYMSIMATHLIALVILSKICLIISNWYINKVKKI